MVAMVPLLTPVDGYYTTFYNHIAMVLTPLRDPGKTMVEPHFILQGSLLTNSKITWAFEINFVGFAGLNLKQGCLVSHNLHQLLQKKSNSFPLATRVQI